MVVITNTEAHFTRGPDGIVRSSAANASYNSWVSYLAVSGSVTVLARVSDAQDCVGHEVEGPGVRVHRVPAYRGIWGTLASPLRTYLAVRAVADAPSAVFCVRLPSIIGGILILAVRKRSRPYAVEAIGDAYDVLRSGIVPRPVGLIASYFFLALMKWQCKNASLAKYVTSSALQRRYPPRTPDLAFAVSDVELKDDAFVDQPRRYGAQPPFRLLVVGSMSQRYKGHHVLIDALGILKAEGIRCAVSIAGEGRLETRLREHAQRMGLSEEVTFLGQVDRCHLQELLDSTDLFVLPSLTEGMPRALIEAMARAVPCVASAVGGVPELLEDRWCIEPGSAQRLAEAVRALLESESCYMHASLTNLHAARKFSERELSARRAGFFARLRELHCDPVSRV